MSELADPIEVGGAAAVVALGIAVEATGLGHDVSHWAITHYFQPTD